MRVVVLRVGKRSFGPLDRDVREGSRRGRVDGG
jgi:hypothetical protein